MSVDNPLISIITPVYNTELYLERCVNSVLNQTYRNFELILIDDGSSDGSFDICCKYSQLDGRVRVFKQINSGPSVARNMGINASQGEYLFFVDSDDWVPNNVLEILLSSVQKNKSDISICDYIMVQEGTEDAYNENQENDIISINYETKEAVKNLFLNGVYYSHPCAKLFKKTLWSGLEFPKGKIYEDLFTIPEVISRAERVSYIIYTGYYYFIRYGSFMHRRFNVHDLDYLDAYGHNIQLFSATYPEIVPNITTKWCEAFICVYNKIAMYSDSKTLRDYMDKYLPTFRMYSRHIMNESVNRYYKLLIQLMRFSPRGYRTLSGILGFVRRKYS